MLYNMGITILGIVRYLFLDLRFESNVESYCYKTKLERRINIMKFESNVESYCYKTLHHVNNLVNKFESNVESYCYKT